MKRRTETKPSVQDGAVHLGHIDAVDRTLLLAIADDPMLSAAALATRAGISESTALRRRQRLEAMGVIEGYSATIDQRVFGNNDRLFIEVELRSSEASAVSVVRQALAERGRLLTLEHIVGSSSLIAVIAVTSASQSALDIRLALERIPSVRSVVIRILGPKSITQPTAALIPPTVNTLSDASTG